MTSQEIKSLELNEKIEYFRNIFSNLNNENEFDILNIFRLVNSYNTFDDDFFDHEGSYITDIAEFKGAVYIFCEFKFLIVPPLLVFGTLHIGT